MYLSDAGQAQMTYTVFQMYHSLNDVVSKDFHKHFLITFFKTTTADWWWQCAAVIVIYDVIKPIQNI